MPFFRSVTSRLLSTLSSLRGRAPIHSQSATVAHEKTTVGDAEANLPRTLKGPSAQFRNAGKVAVVTGSSRSIGAAIAKALAEQGANVIVNYGHDPAPAAEVVSTIKSSGKGDAVAVKANASTIEGGRTLLQETLKAFGRLDILVLNAGIMGSKTLKDVDEAFFDAHFNTNLKGPLFLVKEAANVLPARAVEQISRVLAKDLGTKGLTVNTVSPGPVDTPLFRDGKPQHIIDMIAAQNPSNRLAQPEDIAPIVAFLARPEAQWINGQNIRVNGIVATIPLSFALDSWTLECQVSASAGGYPVPVPVVDPILYALQGSIG
ncbi:short-chain dehydrogenase reductase sdr [Moniliophthora roreri]|nr:short-chain dehydrogenase reductase sdr [Moniliophthora roreri]